MEGSKTSSTLQQLHPDWVCMDIEKMGQSFYNNDGAPLNDSIRILKKKTLADALENENKEVLIQYARTTDGLVDNELRSQIWPILLRHGRISSSMSDDEDGDSKEEFFDGKSFLTSPTFLEDGRFASFCLSNLDSNDLPPHRDEEQVKLDIRRSFTILMHAQLYQQSNTDSFTTIVSKADVEALKKTLLNLIIKMLRRYPCLNYYQGYHDIASVVLLVCSLPKSSSFAVDEERAFHILEDLTLLHLRDFMISDINLSINHLRLVPALLEECNPEMFELVKRTSNSYSSSGGMSYEYDFYQGLSSIITLFSHDTTNMHQLLLVWDFIISCGSVLSSVYIYVALMTFHKQRIFNELSITENDLYRFESKIDRDLVHTLISPTSLSQNLCDSHIIEILGIAKNLIEEYPLIENNNSLSTFKLWFGNFNKSSVLLNTSALFQSKDSLDDTIYQNLVQSDISSRYEFLNDLMQAQEKECSNQLVYFATLKQQELELLSTSTTDVETSLANLLSSSISSLASSDFSKRISNKSSAILRKIFHGTHNTEQSKTSRIINYILRNFYKISFTVGFLGFIIHFLLLKDNLDYHELSIYKLFSDYMRTMKESALGRIYFNFFDALLDQMLSATFHLAYGMGNHIAAFHNSLMNADYMREGVRLGQVGLGNIRNDIYNLFG